MKAPHRPSADPQPPRFWRSRYAAALVILGAVALYFLLTEHRAHVAGALPYVLLIGFPLLHVFMHRGHGGHCGGHAHRGGDGDSKTSAPDANQGERS